MTEQRFTEQPLERLLARMATEKSGPAAGSAAASAVGMAAALVAKTARRSHRQLSDAAAISSRADTLLARALQLAEADADAVSGLIAEQAGRDSGRSAAASSATRPVTDVNATPDEIGRLAAEVAELAADLSESGNPRLQADAVTAQRLAEAGGAGCAAILSSNRSTGAGQAAE